MKAYSLDLRERIVRAVDQGYKRADSVKLFGVSCATIKRYLKRRRETARVKPCTKSLLNHCSLSLLKMRRAGFGIAAIFRKQGDNRLKIVGFLR